MKKILFVTESLARGGMERVLVDIANALVKHQYDVTILTYSPTDFLREDLNPAVHYLYRPRNPLTLRRKLPYFHRFYNKNKWETRVSARRLYKYYVGKNKYDIEVGFYRGPSIKIVSGSTNKKSKKYAWVHTDFKLCDPKSITLFFPDLDSAKEAYRAFDQVVCVSEQARKSFLDVIGADEQKVSVIYNMIDTQKIRNMAKEACPIEKRKFTIASVGRLIPDKGYVRLLNAVKKLNEDGFDFELWLIGGGREEDNLKSYAKDNQIDNVIFTGMQKNPYRYLKAADLFVCSSVREGFSLAVAEALSLGLPVLSTRCTGPTEILGNGKYGILAENSEQGLYEGLYRVLEHKDSLSKYADCSADRGLAFDGSRIVLQIKALFEHNENKK